MSDGRFEMKLYDRAQNTYVSNEYLCTSNKVIIVEGIFIQRKELNIF